MMYFMVVALTLSVVSLFATYAAPNLHIHERNTDRRGEKGKAHTRNISGETVSTTNKEHMRTDLTNSQKEVLPTAQSHLPAEHYSSETKSLCIQTADSMQVATGLKLIADMYSDDEHEQ